MAGALYGSGSIGGSGTTATTYLTTTVPLDYTGEKCSSFPTFKLSSSMGHQTLQNVATKPVFPPFHRCDLNLSTLIFRFRIIVT